MDSELPLATREPSALSQQNPIARLLEAVVNSPESSGSKVDAITKLTELYEKMEAKAAEKEFAAAFVRLQSELGSVKAMKAVPNNDGTARYFYAPFEDIMAIVRPLALKHGFAITFSSATDEKRVTQTCTVIHIGGHSRSNSFSARIGSGPPKSSEAQGDGAASTYAKRFALCNAFNIVTEVDTDGADEQDGDKPIDKEKIQYLREQIAETKSNEAQVLHFAGAKSVEEIKNAVYPTIIRMLAAKASRR